MSEVYQVGQVLFAIDNQKFGITPLQIVEHHVMTSLEGTQNRYYVIIGGTQKKTELSSLVGPIFGTSEEAGHHLLTKAAEKIDDLMSTADAIASEHFSISKKDESNKITTPSTSDGAHLKKKKAQKTENSEAVYVDLPDGSRAKLSGAENFEDFNS
jgi:hypothetical protein